MTEDVTNDDGTIQTDSDDDRDHLRTLREKAKQADRLERELTELRRKDVFRDAGLDPANRQHSYFMRGYDGDLDVEKIRQEAAEAGFLTSEPSGVPDEEKQVWARTEQTARSADVAPPPSGEDKFRELHAQAQRERWSADRFNRELMAAADGLGLPTAFDGV